MNTTFLNNVSMESLGLIPTSSMPAIAGFTRDRDQHALIGRTGSIPSQVASVKPRTIRFEHTASRSMSLPERVALLDRLADLLSGSIEVTSTDGTNRRIYGQCSVYDVSVNSPAWLNITPQIVVEIICYNASYHDIEPTQLVLGYGQNLNFGNNLNLIGLVAVPTGTVPHQGKFLLTGATTTPVLITYRSANGVTLGTLTFTPSLASGERLEIDLQSEQFVKYNTSNVPSLVQSWDTTPVATAFRAVYPRDAQRDNNLWPTLESNYDIVYQYRRNWEN